MKILTRDQKEWLKQFVSGVILNPCLGDATYKQWGGILAKLVAEMQLSEAEKAVLKKQLLNMAQLNDCFSYRQIQMMNEVAWSL